VARNTCWGEMRLSRGRHASSQGDGATAFQKYRHAIYNLEATATRLETVNTGFVQTSQVHLRCFIRTVSVQDFQGPFVVCFPRHSKTLYGK